ncbi:MAG: agmatinase family protein [Bdellovibrionia bacterium]
MTHFDPNAAATSDSGIFGLPYTQEEASIVYLPVPWEATTSYGGGTSNGPDAILAASRQVDLFDLDVNKPYEPGLFMLPESKEVRAWNEKGKAEAAKIIEVGGNIEGDASLAKSLATVNELSEKLNQYVYQETKKILDSGKIAAVVGGDHSVPFGALQAVADKYPSFGVLHFDAHSDTRDAYEGFQWSHASIMRNVLDRIPAVKKLVQVGIRDVCEEEIQYTKAQGDRMSVFFDRDLARRRFQGTNWATTALEIVDQLPQEVWVSFDIDGLDPRFCPNTGTPVAGGLDFQEANFILNVLAKSGRKIIGFDLNEVAPDPKGESEWDANVGARMLYKMTAWTLASLGKAKIQD